jgi:hypothetical protein
MLRPAAIALRVDPAISTRAASIAIRSTAAGSSDRPSRMIGLLILAARST